MWTLEEMKRDLRGILDAARNPRDIGSFLLLLPITRRRLKSLRERCVDLYEELSRLATDAEAGRYSRRLLDIDEDYRHVHGKLLLATAALIGLGCVLALGLLWYYGGLVKQVLKVEDPNRVIVFGIAGAFIYLAAEFVSPGDDEKRKRTGIAKAGESSLRVLLAVVVPVFFVALLFTREGKLGEWKVSPEVLAFACGYNAKIAIGILNKVVEKASNIIDAL